MPFAPRPRPPAAACIFWIACSQPFLPPACFAMFAIMRYWQSRSSTSRTLVPLPLATRVTRHVSPVGLPSLPHSMNIDPSESSSAAVMLSVM